MKSSQTTFRLLDLFYLIILICSIFYSSLSLIIYSLGLDSRFVFWRIPKIPSFIDLQQLTHSSGCDASFYELLNNLKNCDPVNRPFNYTSFSLYSLRLFGVNSDSSGILGLLIGLIAISTVCLFFWKALGNRNYWKLLAAISILSFPFQLAIERGNHDLVVFCLCLILSSLALKQNIRNIVLSGILAFLSGVLKIFPVFGIVPWVLCRKPQNKVVTFSIIVPSILSLIYQVRDIPLILANTPRPGGYVSFGLLTTHGAGGFGVLIIAAKIVLIISAFLMIYKFFIQSFSETKILSLLRRQKTLSVSSFVLSGWILVATYFLSRSWDYRFIFIIGILPFCFQILDITNSPKLKNYFIKPLTDGILFISFEQYLPLTNLFNRLSDFIIQPIIFGALAFVLLLVISSNYFDLTRFRGINKFIGNSREVES